MSLFNLLENTTSSCLNYTPIKGRTLVIGQKVRVYVNLNRNGFFSIQDAKTRLVVGYAKSVLLSDAVFTVSLGITDGNPLPL